MSSPRQGSADELSQARKALIEKRLRGEMPESGIRPRAHDDSTVPASFAQRRLWVLDQLQPGKTGYTMLRAMEITGPLNPAALENALLEVVRRHQSLRTRFGNVDGQPVQIIDSGPKIALKRTDISGASDEEVFARAEEALRNEAEESFDLQRGPLLRIHLLRERPERHILLLAMHHIVSDDWSMEVFFREIISIYEGISALPELSIQYADYSEWQRERLQGDALKKLQEYWKEQLAGAPGILQLPTARARPVTPTFRGNRERVCLSSELTDALRELKQREGATLFMVLLAAFQTLLWRYTGQDDIVVGTPTAGRRTPETEALVGFFVNTLSLRTRFSDEITFHDLLQQVKKTALAAYDHQDLPFEKLVECLNPERTLDQNPLVQVMFSFQTAGKAIEDGQSVRWRPLDLGVFRAIFDLQLEVVEEREQLTCSFIYSEDVFDADSVRRMAGHFECLVQSIVADPQKRLSTLNLLTDLERKQVLFEWSGGTRTYQPEGCVHGQFEAQVKRAPQAIAVACENETLTYAELNRRANQVAHHLRRMGVGPEERVGLLVERSLDLVVALLGILKAGGAYVPVDPGYPRERIRFVLADWGVRVVVTEEKLCGLAAANNVVSLCMDRDRHEITKESQEDPHSGVTPENLAYVIYTSGSTGRPKGVLVSHYNVARLFDATQEWFNFTDRDVWTLFHSCAFDFSVWEFWGALRYGGKLVVVPYLTSRTPESFYNLLRQQKVTVLNQTPSAFRQLIQAEADAGVAGDLALRLVIFGGEALELSALSPWFERHGDHTPKLVNMYGITETTVHVTYRPLSMKDIEAGAGSVIGCAIPDLAVYLLDRHGQPTPVGIPGEIYVGGAGVARGYLNRDELTRERFLPDRFASSGEGRLYRSGDQARRLPGGELEYLGRIDQQVKIRGFRIELGEIEATLLAHATVREAVVMAREESSGDKRLVAYVVPVSGKEARGAELREHLRERLPDYMVPSAFVSLESLPLTSNGKVDRQALPSPDAPEQEEYVAPRNEVERRLAEIWAAVLGVERVGIRDNFFAMGGHSLLATRLIGRMRDALRQEVSIRALFEHPTIEGVSRILTEPGRPANTLMPPITRAARGRENG